MSLPPIVTHPDDYYLRGGVMTTATRELKNVADYLQFMVEVAHRNAADRPPSSLAYACMEEFILLHGQPFRYEPQLPRGYRRGRQKQCFGNAYRMAAIGRGVYRYCEGFATGIIPVFHAWVVDECGTAFDPTWPKPDKRERREYFGVAFPDAVVDAAVLLSERYGVLDDWQHGWPLMQQTYDPQDAVKRLTDLRLNSKEA